ncbi:MAG TPA: condensation domain-containing protein, partial [Pyrinomonadaceae bacterium]|nr:condensation domain-containing protein [Pyrinomonadaceae bacterium]
MKAAAKNIEAIYSLSPIQEGLLLDSLRAPASHLYHCQFPFTLHEVVDVAAFQKAWQTAVSRHAVLRTIFVWEGMETMRQVVLRKADLPLRVEDWRAFTKDEQQQKLADYYAQDRNSAFDFSQSPPIRLALFRVEDERYEFICSCHHVLLDGWSCVLLFKEVAAHYRAYREGRELRLPKPRPYRDYVSWLKKLELSEAEAHWRRTLQDFVRPSTLPLVDDARSFSDERREWSQSVSEQTTRALERIARDSQLTLNTIVQGAWALLLNLHSGEPDVVFGSTVSGRSIPLEGVESMIGVFINTLPVRVRIERELTVEQWLRRIQQDQAAARQFEFTPLVQIHGCSDVPGNVPLFNSIVVFENFPTEAFEENYQVDAHSRAQRNIKSSVPVQLENTNYPLSLHAIVEQSLKLRLQYDPRLFSAEASRQLLDRFNLILESLAREPRSLSEIEWLTGAERARILSQSKGNAAPVATEIVTQLIERQATENPDAVAVVHGEAQLSYRELDQRAEELASYLCGFGIGSEQVIAICLSRSPEMVVALLGVLKAGAAYMPLDPAHPPERLAYMLDEVGPPLMLTEESLRERLPSSWAQVVCLDADWEEIKQYGNNRASAVSGKNLAYVIYTSGSTGRPKGVMVAHKGIVN